MHLGEDVAGQAFEIDGVWPAEGDAHQGSHQRAGAPNHLPRASP